MEDLFTEELIGSLLSSQETFTLTIGFLKGREGGGTPAARTTSHNRSIDLSDNPPLLCMNRDNCPCGMPVLRLIR